MVATNPVLYQINTRVWVKRFGATATLADVPPAYWTQLAKLGVDYVWLMGAWQTGPNVLAYALEPGLQHDYNRVLPDWTEADVIGSPYAIDSYTLHEDLGPPEVLAETRAQINAAGMRLILDFVPNHFHAESRWLAQRPEVFLTGNESLLQQDDHTFYRSEVGQGRIVAHGKDPYFAAWQDTVQLNYAASETHAFMAEQLRTIAAQCDGVRCDMAMLLLPEVFHRTWKHALATPQGSYADFWSATIADVKATYPDFQLLAEVYWDLEWELQQRGFDYTYDKRLLDRLHQRDATAIRDHLRASPDFQQRSVRFLENHDEDRALATMSPSQVQAAAIVAYTVPGLRFFYEGQWEGRRRRLPVQLGRLPVERDALDQYGRGLQAIELAALPGFDPVSQREPAFYDWLLALLRELILRRGQWELLETHYPALLAWRWHHENDQLTILVNYRDANFTANLSANFPKRSVRDVWGQTLAVDRLWFGAFAWKVLRH
jgi:glycosidase